MNYSNWLLWLGGTLLPLGLLWALWRLALRPERCYGYNRALLLLAPVLAAALPLLPRPALPAWLAGAVATSSPVAAVTLPVLPVGATAPHVAVVASELWLLALYAAGVALGLGRLAWQTGRLWQLARRLPRFEHDGYALVQTGGRLPTSTFGRVVFWDETVALAPAEATAVLAHELTHVRQHHTLDVLWLQVWRAVLWPNPFVHLLLPALRLTHELLADQAAAAVPTGPPLAAPADSTDSYATLLARLATRQLAGPAYSLLQPFAFSSTLTRIAMLQNQFPVRRWKQWLVLPVLGGLFFLSSYTALAQTTQPMSEAEQKANRDDIRRKVRAAMHQDSLRTGGKFEPGTTQQVNVTNMNGKPGEAVVTITRVLKYYPVGPQPVTSTGHKIFAYVEQMPQLPGGGGQMAIVRAIQQGLKYPVSNTTNGHVFVNFTVDDDGVVQNPKIIKSLNDACDQAALAAVKQLPQFVPGMQDGQAVAVSFTVPIEFRQ